MSNVTGIVNEVKAFPTKTGSTMYSLIVDGTRYGLGSTAPGCKIGDTVSFDVVEKNGYMNVAPRTLKTVASGGAGAAVKQVAQAANANDVRQDTISKQAASNTAIAFVNMLVGADAIPGVTAKMDPAKKYDILEALVEKKAADFFAFATGKSLPNQKRLASPFVPDAGQDDTAGPDDALPEW